ncbi:MAG TPA: glycosyltransferase family 1 protein [Gaiellaceae bacterium]|jgi:alpha-1,3-rhamnosyl/mannosyltransferase|nr:glycosyltransferase family 1 protein [Gaiellaceae bacterium]
MSVVVFDADVLGRHRTGDETYALNLLRELGPLAAADGIRLVAVTRHPELVPEGVEAHHLPARSQELRMAWTLPRALRGLGAALSHTQHALPLRSPCPGVVTVHDVSFARNPDVMGWRDRTVFRIVVPRALRGARRVLTVSERTKRDLVELYEVDPDDVVVTPNGVDRAFTPGPGSHDYVLSVGAVQRRKNQLAALEAAHAAGLPLVIVGPEKDASLAAELRAGGARLEGYVETSRLVELYRGAACLVQSSSYEGFGLPVVEAMASGTPVVAVDEPALREVAGDAAVVVGGASLADGIRTALGERERLVAAGLERARAFSWQRAAERTLAVYREILDT